MSRTASSDVPDAAAVRLRRAAAFAAVGTLSLVVPVAAARLPPPLATVVAIGPFVAIAAVSLYGVTSGPVFELFARPADRKQGRLYALAGFSLAVAGMALFVTRFGMPPGIFVASVLLVVYGNLVQQATPRAGSPGPLEPGAPATDGATQGTAPPAQLSSTEVGLAGSIDRLAREPAAPVVAFTVGGTLAALAGIGLTAALVDIGVTAPAVAFLTATGALLAALVRAVLFERDDPVVLLSVGLLLWLLADLAITPPATRVGIGAALAIGFGALAYAIGAASVTGMLAGILLALLAVVLGGYGWFAVLLCFFGLGGLVSKFRYEEKLARGVAQANEGARSSANVLANASAALVALLGFAASGRLGVAGSVFLLAYTGSVAAATSDTFSSEFGGLFDRPRLITTLEPVDPGTDGAVTWQGEIAGLVGAGIVAGVAVIFFDFALADVGVVVLAGVAGMTVDSLLGATIEGGAIGNQGVNLAATFAAAILAGALGLWLGL